VVLSDDCAGRGMSRTCQLLQFGAATCHNHLCFECIYHLGFVNSSKPKHLSESQCKLIYAKSVIEIEFSSVTYFSTTSAETEHNVTDFILSRGTYSPDGKMSES
jgi:hypothetical protein